MKNWLNIVVEFFKVLLIFVICTLFFYFGLRFMHEEYDQFHRYDKPKGNAVKVSDVEDGNWLDRLSIFFRLGE
ncbi:DUF4227 family protein [Salirhabdus salicampi]|uniref:DUF4227 family protein n=1 Tax=Salirhabdus salicampi TaxID=476102 RepID=UPI0020C4F2ED|nr:DUF4227 family protein [Salirhabdus salicampi]MCP8616771.1 YqzK family protein [Salirhabdus salicampi]